MPGCGRVEMSPLRGRSPWCGAQGNLRQMGVEYGQTNPTAAELCASEAAEYPTADSIGSRIQQ